MRRMLLGFGCWMGLVFAAAQAQVVVGNGSEVEYVDCYQRKGRIVNTWVDLPPDSVKPYVIFNPNQYEFAAKRGRMFAVYYHYVNHCCTDMVHSCEIYFFVSREAFQGRSAFIVPAREAVTASCMGGRWLLPAPFDSVIGSLRLHRKILGRWKMEVQLEGHYDETDTMKLPVVDAKVRRFPRRHARDLKPRKDNYWMI